MAAIDFSFVEAGKFLGTFCDKKPNDFSEFRSGDRILFAFSPTDGGAHVNYYDMVVVNSEVDLLHQVAHLKEVVLNITATPRQVLSDGFNELFYPVYVLPYQTFKSNNAICQPGMALVFFIEYFTIESDDGTISPRMVFTDDEILYFNTRFFAMSKYFTTGPDGREMPSVDRNQSISRCIEN
jgi:hypothetical protein